MTKAQPFKSQSCLIKFEDVSFNELVHFDNIQKVEGQEINILLENIRFCKNLKISNNKNGSSPKFIFSNNNFESRTIFLNDCDISTIGVEGGNWYGFVFGNCKWKEHWALFPSKIRCFAGNKEQPLKEQYASLKLAAEESGDKQLAAEFNFWQLWHSLKWSTPINFLYLVTCRYGLDYLLPILWIVLIAFH